MISPSPLADAVDIPVIVEKVDELKEVQDLRKGEISLIKIGQTTLHNPRGRSSWIGL